MPDALTDALADTFALNLGMAERLLAQHLDDGSGRCRACSSGAHTGHHTWPCSIHYHATRAAKVQRRRAPLPAALHNDAS